MNKSNNTRDSRLVWVISQPYNLCYQESTRNGVTPVPASSPASEVHCLTWKKDNNYNLSTLFPKWVFNAAKKVSRQEFKEVRYSLERADSKFSPIEQQPKADGVLAL